ncbi:MAG: hypothetical protein HQM14_09815 [SAR324 cluster bacterium]|nr:hypothetical protein [SAR324 cluster bacterium]
MSAAACGGNYSILKNWDILIASDPLPNKDPLKVVNPWIGINVLMLDEERVIVEKKKHF